MLVYILAGVSVSGHYQGALCLNVGLLNGGGGVIRGQRLTTQYLHYVHSWAQ